MRNQPAIGYLLSMAATKRKFMAVTMKPELYQEVRDLAAGRDISATAWVREVVVAELVRQRRYQRDRR